MKLIIILLLASFSFSVSAQTKSKAIKKTSSSQKSRVASNKSAPSTDGTQSIKDRIERRLKDSSAAASASTNQTKTTNQTKITEQVNGITIAQPNTNTNNTVTNGNGSTINNSNGLRTTNGVMNNNGTNTNGVVNGQVMQQGANMSSNNAAGGAVSNNPIANKPVTNEQSQYNTTDINRNQMNAVNQNQNASSTIQNPASKTWGQNTVGEAQWGQNQVGENQWTPPNQITTSFTNDFPTIRGATWSRDNTMNNFTARYRSGDSWTTSTYSSTGVRKDTRTELAITGNLPTAITTYKSKQNLPIDFTRISKVERPGKAEVYEVRLNSGKLIYLNSKGVEVGY